ncbi:MAG: hypothetical protein JJE04_20535 [Acidobacteriia bacterium]|nr:hypothetical protein [Terriglobia bacterium]
MILAGLLLQAAIYSGDIAPLLAFHCNRCHGDEITGGGVDTRTYQSLRRTTSLALMLELMEGRRGPTQRMPKDAPPLDDATVARFRRWIEAGAPLDQEPTGEILRRQIRKKKEIRIQVKTGGQAYVIIEILDIAGRPMHREAGVIQNAGLWRLRAGSHWPSRLIVQATVRFASGPATLAIAP